MVAIFNVSASARAVKNGVHKSLERATVESKQGPSDDQL